MTLIRKTYAGDAAYPDGGGDEWPEDGSVVDVTPVHASLLLAIPDGGFSEVDEPAAEPKAPVPTPVAAAAQKRVVRKIAE